MIKRKAFLVSLTRRAFRYSKGMKRKGRDGMKRSYCLG